MSPIHFDPDFAALTDYAYMYRQLGLQVVPSYHPSEAKSWKRPLLSSWKEFETTLVPDSQFEKWWGPDGSHRHKTNIGLITGDCSNDVFVLDVDLHTKPEAQAWLVNLLDSYNDGKALNCPCQQTGGGGFQYLFRAPGHWPAPTMKTPIGIDIRGQGGFAVLAPSMHESGREYQWVKDKAPWQVEIPEAPPWLLMAIDDLVRKYVPGTGGHNERNVQTPTPAQTTNQFGLIIDGREEYMTKVVFAKVLSLYRESPILPSAERLQDAKRDAFSVYERKVKSRIQEVGTPNHILLEREGRGYTEFNAKWNYLLKQWETKVADAAGQPSQRILDVHEGDENKDSDHGGQYFDTIKASISSDLGAGAEAIDCAKAPEWIVRGALPVAGANLAGTGGTGKTTLTLNEYVRIVNGMDLYDTPVNRAGICILVTAEDGANHPRYVLKQVLKSGIDCGELTIDQANRAKERIKVVGWDRSKYGPIATVDGSGNLHRSPVFELLIDLQEPLGASVVTLDPAALFSPGERFGNDGEAFIASMIHEAALRLGCHLQVLDHVSQEAARSGAIHQHAARGGTAKTDNARMARQLVTFRAGKTENPKVNDLPPPDISPEDIDEGKVLQLHWTKSNYGPKPKMVWLKREGYWLSHKKNNSPEQSKDIWEERKRQQHETEERLVISKVSELLKQKKFPCKSILEISVYDERGERLSKRRTSSAIERCLKNGSLIECDVPKDKRQGRRTHYLRPHDNPS